MDNRIAIIFPNATLVSQTKKILEERQLKYPIFEASRTRALNIALNCIEKNAKIIISRGGTAAFLKEMLEIPVVEVRFTYFDFAYSVQKALAVSTKIAIIGASSAFSSAQRFRQFLGDDVRIVHIKTNRNVEQEIEETIRTLITQGIEVVIGGSLVVNIGKKYGLHTISTEVDEYSITQALDEAIYNLRIESDREEKLETIQSILACASEGIVGIDIDGKVTNINSNAKRLLGLQPDAVCQDIKLLLPNSKLMDTVRNGYEIIGEVCEIGQNSIVLNSVPIITENEIIGAVAILQESNKISILDQKIKKKLLAKGHVAKANFEDIKGNSPAILTTKEKARKYSRVESTLLILGETGTGKELFAQSIHNFSDRKDKPFVAINCAAISPSLLESELFGYVKGAFTGASNEGKPGIFEIANTGTIFLDEISEISHEVQVRLLRVIQEREVIRIGDDKIFSVDVRIIAASNKNLAAEVQKNNFREDLYYRLCVLILELPPLRSRKEDIYELAKFFIELHSKKHNKHITDITFTAIRRLKALEWPGNIRQFGNAIERMVVISEKEVIDENLVLEAIEHWNNNDSLSSEDAPFSFITEEMLNRSQSSEKGFLCEVEEELIKNVLKNTKGNKTEAANILGISKATLWRRLNKMD